MDGRPFSGVIYAHQLPVSIGEAIRDIEMICKVLVPEEIANEVLFLPL